MVTIKHLNFNYEKLVVFSDFNFHVPEGQVCLVTGINGVGKSTLLRLIAGVLRPDSGEINFSEKLGKTPRQKIGFISDRLSLYESMTVKSAIELHCTVFKVSNFDDSLLKHIKVDFKSKIKNLSIGQRTILHLSLILSSNPELLLIDEVIHSLDAYLRKLFLEKIVNLLGERSLTVIMVNVNFHDIEHLVDRVILLKSGKIEVDEPIDALKEKVKKLTASEFPEGIPVLSRVDRNGFSEFYIYPFQPEYQDKLKGQLLDLNLTEIVTAFIGGEYM